MASKLAIYILGHIAISENITVAQEQFFRLMRNIPIFEIRGEFAKHSAKLLLGTTPGCIHNFP